MTAAERTALDASRWRKFLQAAKRVWSSEKGCLTFYLPRAKGGDFESFEATVDALHDPGPLECDATGKASTLTVVLNDDADAEALQMVYSCLSVLRGVISVQANVEDPNHYAAVESAKHDLRKKLLTVIAQDTKSRPFPRPE